MQLAPILPEYVLSIIPQDKILHFLVSFFLVVVFFGIRKYYLQQQGFLRIFAYSVRDVILIGLFKECIDFLGFGNPELSDFIADVSGIIIPIYIFFNITLYKKLRESRKIKYEKKYILDFKSEKNIFRKLKILLLLIIIWFGNTCYLFLKIPLLAMKETVLFIKRGIYILKK